ncbi:MAG: hypothetical protein ACI8Q1_001329, partial [Parvicella sp.]
NKIDEVIFAAKNLSSQEIIRQMSLIKTNNSVDYKIAQPDSLYLIGSNSIHTAGDIYLLDLNSITTAQNTRNKRIVDVCSSLILLTLSPIAIWFQKNPIRFFKNIFLTIVGRKTWVGYNQLDSGPQHGLPKLKPNILPLIHSSQVDISILRKTNLIYAKDYKITKDLKVIYINFRQLGS